MKRFLQFLLMSALIVVGVILYTGVEATENKKDGVAPVSDNAMSLCSSMSKGVTELLVEDFAKRYGVKVNVQYMPEGTWQERLEFLKNNDFDCWFGGTAEECYLADQDGVLSSYKSQEFYKMPVELRNREGKWTSIFLEYIAFVSNTNKLRDNGLYAPDTWQELLLPEFKNEITMVDFTNGGTSYAMITSIWQLRGKEAALKYAGRLNKQNIYFTNTYEEAVDKVNRGEKMVAVVPLRTAILLETKYKHLFATIIEDANRNLLNCAAVMDKATNIEAARNFIDYLLSDNSEAALRAEGYHYIWHAKNYPYNDGRKELIGNVNVPVDDLSWTAVSNEEIVAEWLKAWPEAMHKDGEKGEGAEEQKEVSTPEKSEASSS